MKNGNGTLIIAVVCRTHWTLVDPRDPESGHGPPRPGAELPHVPVNCPGQKAVSLGVSVRARVCGDNDLHIRHLDRLRSLQIFKTR